MFGQHFPEINSHFKDSGLTDPFEPMVVVDPLEGFRKPPTHPSVSGGANVHVSAEPVGDVIVGTPLQVSMIQNFFFCKLQTFVIS